MAAGESESPGVSVHLVDEEYDRGPVIAQSQVPVLPNDTPETLAARVLECEHALYPQTIQRIATGDIDLDSGSGDDQRDYVNGDHSTGSWRTMNARLFDKIRADDRTWTLTIALSKKYSP